MHYMSTKAVFGMESWRDNDDDGGGGDGGEKGRS